MWTWLNISLIFSIWTLVLVFASLLGNGTIGLYICSTDLSFTSDFEVNLIEGLTSEHDTEIEYESNREFELESDDFNLDQIIESTVEWATNATPILPLHKESFELKVLPSHLKYQYLGARKHSPW